MSGDFELIRAWHAEWDNEAMRHKVMPAGEASLWEDVDLLLSELDRRDAILRTLAAVEEPIYDSMYCMLCDARPSEHSEVCPWRQAKELVGDE